MISFPSKKVYSSRIIEIDALRGFAVVLMIIYHFCYDLSYLRLITSNFYHHPFWLSFRGLIVTLFVITVGISLHLAVVHHFSFSRFIKRLLILIICAALISLVTFIQFQQRFIFFGILHFIVLASVLGLWFIERFWLNLFGGIILLVVGSIVQHPLFDQPSLQWVGLMTYKPATEDYVPLLPWFGVILLGLFLGQWLSNINLNRINRKWVKPFTWLGQHSLLIYMVHQPILLGGLWIFLQVYSIF